jgi:hypothetical protein
VLLEPKLARAVALKSARILIERGWTSAKEMAETTWEERVRALGEGGYVRYDVSANIFFR